MLQGMLGGGEMVSGKNHRELSCNLGSTLRINKHCGVVLVLHQPGPLTSSVTVASAREEEKYKVINR